MASAHQRPGCNSLMSRLPTIDPELPDQAELVVRRLSRYADLTQEEIALLRGLAQSPERLAPGTALLAEGDSLDHARLMLAGWGCRLRYLSDGRRQIFDFILPGDMYGLCMRQQAVALCSAVTLTRATISDASALGEAVAENSENHCGLKQASLMAASIDEAYLLDHLMRIGRQTAYERVAHIILELHHRLSIVGLANENVMPLPLTQEMMADALGLSVVHLNRTLQQLRRDGLVEVKGGLARLLDMSRLKSISDFRVPRISATRFDDDVDWRAQATAP